jgi:uncharacterized membrane protein
LFFGHGAKIRKITKAASKEHSSATLVIISRYIDIKNMIRNLLTVFLLVVFSACNQKRTEEPVTDPAEFTAVGNEPFWSLDIIPSDKWIVLKDMSIEKTFYFLYTPANKNSNSYFYDIVNDKGDKIKITIKEETCSDGMSDRKYTYSSKVVINGRTLKGCAIKKDNTLLTLNK